MQTNVNYLILCICLMVPLPTHAMAESIVFDNLSDHIVLTKNASHYRVEGTALNVELSGRIILKTTSSITKQDIYNYHRQVEQVKALFESPRFHYYLVSLKDPEKLGEVLKAIKIIQNENGGINLIQPDILQMNVKSEASASLNNEPPYISQLNVQSLWASTKGKGVKVAIVDDGFNLQHPDLQHITPVFTYDAETGQLASSPRSVVDGHGTKVAGIIFAAHNQMGIKGIAPEADFIAIRQPDTWTSNTLLSFQLAKLAGASVINCSWHSRLLLEPVADVVNELAQYGRNGKGIAVIFAAGNDGIEILPNSTESAIESAIVVGAVDGELERLSFSNYGETVDLSVYGKGVKTTRATGDYGVFAGTSLASAIVSGLSALLLSQNPDMSLRQLTQQLKQLTTTH